MTYLNQQGRANGSNSNVPEIPGRISARFALGGELVSRVGVGVAFASTFQLGGDFRGNIYPPVTLGARFSLGGELDVSGNGTAAIRATFALGGVMVTDLTVIEQVRLSTYIELGGTMGVALGAYTRQELGAVFSLGGEERASVGVRRFIAAEFEGGGNARFNIYPPLIIPVSYELGGSMTSGLTIIQSLGARFSGGGNMSMDTEPYFNNLTLSRQLIVGGGAGGGYTSSLDGAKGGGGGGEVIEIDEPVVIPVGIHPVFVGQGGPANSNGQSSSFNGAIAIGGGRGGHRTSGNSGANGGGGGGGVTGLSGRTGGAGTKGFAGGAGGSPSSSAYGNAGGGAGMAEAGTTALGTINGRGFGGEGIVSDITGTPITYGSGGGGGSRDGGLPTPGGPGAGSGGSGITGPGNAANGQVGRGGGGGGGAYFAGSISGAGGSGTVILRYPGPARATGGTILTIGEDTVHIFTTDGFLEVEDGTKRIGAAFSGGGEMTANAEVLPQGVILVGAGAMSNSNGALNLSAPNDTQIGDLMLLAYSSNGAALNSLSGWTAVTDTSISSGTTTGVIYYRVATEAGPVGTNAVTIPDPGNHHRGQILAFRDAGTPYTAGRNGLSGSGTSYAFPGAVAFDADDYFVAMYSCGASAGTFTLDANSDFDGETITGQGSNTLVTSAVAVGKAVATGLFTPPSATASIAGSPRLTFGAVIPPA